MEAVSKILVSSSDLFADKKGLKNLKDGQIVSARVTGNLSSRTAELQIFGKKIPVRTFVPLLTGTEVKLMVSKKGGEVVLKLQDPPKNQSVVPRTDKPGNETVSTGKSSVGARLHTLKSLGKSGPFGNLVKLLDVLKQNSSPGKNSAQAVSGQKNPDSTVKGGDPQRFSAVGEKALSGKGTSLASPRNLKTSTMEMATTAQTKLAEINSGQMKSAEVRTGGKPVPDPSGGINTPGLKSILSSAATVGKLEVLSPADAATVGKLEVLSPADAVKVEAALLKGQSLTDALSGILSRESGVDSSGHSEKIMAARIKHPHAALDLQGEKTENLVKLIDRAMVEMALKSDKPDAGLIPRVIKNSGLEFEKNLSAIIDSPPADRKAYLQNLGEHDLKAIALKILATPEAEGSELGRSVSTFVDSLENMQNLNRETFNDLGRVLLPLPVDYGEFIKFGQLLIDLGKDEDSGKSKDQRLIKVSFLLEMTELGDLRADFSILKKGINGTFGATSQEACTLIEENLPELTANLAKHDFQVHKIECCLLTRQTLAGTTLADELAGDEAGLLNIII